MHRIEANGNGDRQFRTLLTLGAVGQGDDAELLARFVAGSGGGDDAAEFAFAALVDRHGPTVLRVARTVLGDEATALDAFQATFLILAQKARNLRVDRSLTPWLAAVARRVALGARRARARRSRLEQAAARPEAVAASAFSHDVWGETLRAVLNEVDRLPEPYRAAVVACHLDGLTQREAADRLNWPVGTLQSRLDRGRRQLRDRLTRQGLAPSALGLLPPTGLSVSLPPGLATTLSQAAACWTIRSNAPPMIALGVLAILHPHSKGFLMANLKVGALVLGATIVAAGSGWSLGLGSSPRPDGKSSPASSPTPQPPRAASAASPADVAIQAEDLERLGNQYSAPSALIEGAGANQAPPSNQAPSAATDDDLGAPGSRRQTQLRPPTTTTGEPPAPVSPVPTPEKRDDIPISVDGPGLATLLCFADFASEQSHSIAPMVIELINKGYPVRNTRIERFRDLVERFDVKQSPTFLLIDLTGKEVARTSEPRSARQLADFYNEHRPKDVAQASHDSDEPSLTVPIQPPRPWETVARIKVHITNKEWGFGSGTVIASTKAESFVLCCAHIFRDQDGKISSLGRSIAPVSIDLFDSKITDFKKPQLNCVERDLRAEVVALHEGQDLALVRIHPGRVLPVAPIAPASWTPVKGIGLISVGCSNGNDATAWDTRIIEPKVKMNSRFGPFFTIKCTNQPADGRSGGGLFTKDGYLVGMCSHADLNEKTGLYLESQAFQGLTNGLERIGDEVGLDLIAASRAVPGLMLIPKTAIRRGQPEPMASGEPAIDPSVSSQEQRLNDLERKLDRVLQSLDNIRGGLRLDKVAPQPIRQ